MKTEERIYIALTVFFSVLIVTSNLVYQKFITLPFFLLELSCGALAYPLTFFISDFIAEFYGKEKANFCVKLGVYMNIIVAIIIAIMSKLDATVWSKVDNATFHLVFGAFSISFIASIIASFISGLIDIKLYLWIKEATGGKYILLRSSISTGIALFIDTAIVISILDLLNVIDNQNILGLIGSSYLFKISLVIAITPLFYVAVRIVRGRE